MLFVSPGDVLKFSATYTNGTGIVDQGIGSISSGTTKLNVPSATETATLTVTGPGGSTQSTVDITIVPFPDATITAATPIDPVIGDSPFSGAVPLNSYTISYQWIVIGGNIIGSNTNRTISVAVDIVDEIVLICTVKNSVGDTTIGVKNILVRPTPTNITGLKLDTFAGLFGNAAYVDGPFNTGQLVAPGGCVLAPDGYLYVLENEAIRRIDSSGTISEYANTAHVTHYSTYFSTYVNGPVATAVVNAYGNQIILGPDGNLYFSWSSTSTGSGAIRKVDLTTNTISTVAGPHKQVVSTTLTTADVLDVDSGTVSTISLASAQTYLDKWVDGSLINARFGSIYGMVFVGNLLYVYDDGTNAGTIRRVDVLNALDNSVTTIAGRPYRSSNLLNYSAQAYGSSNVRSTNGILPTIALVAPIVVNAATYSNHFLNAWPATGNLQYAYTELDQYGVETPASPITSIAVSYDGSHNLRDRTITLPTASIGAVKRILYRGFFATGATSTFWVCSILDPSILTFDDTMNLPIDDRDEFGPPTQYWGSTRLSTGSFGPGLGTDSLGNIYIGDTGHTCMTIVPSDYTLNDLQSICISSNIPVEGQGACTSSIIGPILAPTVVPSSNEDLVTGGPSTSQNPYGRRYAISYIDSSGRRSKASPITIAITGFSGTPHAYSDIITWAYNPNAVGVIVYYSYWTTLDSSHNYYESTILPTSISGPFSTEIFPVTGVNYDRNVNCLPDHDCGIGAVGIPIGSIEHSGYLITADGNNNNLMNIRLSDNQISSLAGGVNGMGVFGNWGDGYLNSTGCDSPMYLTAGDTSNTFYVNEWFGQTIHKLSFGTWPLQINYGQIRPWIINAGDSLTSSIRPTPYDTQYTTGPDGERQYSLALTAGQTLTVIVTPLTNVAISLDDLKNSSGFSTGSWDTYIFDSPQRGILTATKLVFTDDVYTIIVNCNSPRNDDGGGFKFDLFRLDTSAI